jgi:hypothetical protein
MLRWFSYLLVFSLALAAAVPSQAQAEPSFSTMRVSLWPEFDRPDLLVIYRFTLSNTTPLPATLTLRIPASGAEVHAVAVGASEDRVGDVPYNRVVDGEWAEISFIASMPSVQFEYYDSNLRREDTARSISYTWPGGYAVETMIVEVQEPLRATEMVISPSLGTRQLRADGLAYYTADLGAITSSQTFNISLEYQKNNDQLSAEQLVVQPSQPITSTASGGPVNGSNLVVVLGFLGLALIIGGGIWYWQSGTRGDDPADRPRRRRKKTGEAKITPQEKFSTRETEAGVYCHQCGKRAAAGDRFCRSCGNRLRAE